MGIDAEAIVLGARILAQIGGKQACGACYAPGSKVAVATTPAGSTNPFARTVPSSAAFPESQAGRLLHYPFRGLLSVYSHYGLYARQVAFATLYTEGFSSFVT